MTPERHARIQRIFGTAVGLDHDACQRYLATACSGEDGVRQEVERLIQSHHRSGDFLDSPVASLLPNDQVALLQPELTGKRVSRYQIQRVIARGGMGIVYEAIQDDLKRTVAVKVMRQGLASRSALRRFRDEVQILSRLRHPNIAQIYEAGTYDESVLPNGGESVPYFAMEFIPDARALTDYAHDHALPVRERLQLYVKVCNAIHHGHQKGIIHRDIKPANILVDPSGEPKIIDFGVARFMNSDLALTKHQTLTGQLIGTIQYMSPEQCDGDPNELDSRTDVYSLGAVLYELLVGQAAYDIGDANVFQAARLIRETRPAALSTINRNLRGDLETIVAKAMERDQVLRYQSAESLKNDIERHLSGEPVEARPRSGWLQVTHWLGRHPVLTAGACASALAGLILAITVLVVFYGLRQPARFVISPDGAVGHLVTLLGRPLQQLGGGESGATNCVQARLVDRPREFGGGEVALIRVLDGENSTESQLWMCNPHDLSRPIWQTEVNEIDSRPFLRQELIPTNRPSRRFITLRFLVADVFTESPGDEIVVIHCNNGNSPVCIRVYDFAKNLHFEAWYLGWIRRIDWWPQEGLLVCAGERHGRPDIEDHGFPAPPPHPRAVFAVRPEFGARVGWLNEPGWPEEWREDPQTTSTLVWYKVLNPLAFASQFTVLQVTTPKMSDSFATVVFDSVSLDTDSSFGLLIDRDGNLVEWNGNDEFNRDWGVPSSTEPKLDDWLPVSSRN